MQRVCQLCDNSSTAPQHRTSAECAPARRPVRRRRHVPRARGRRASHGAVEHVASSRRGASTIEAARGPRASAERGSGTSPRPSSTRRASAPRCRRRGSTPSSLREVVAEQARRPVAAVLAMSSGPRRACRRVASSRSASTAAGAALVQDRAPRRSRSRGGRRRGTRGPAGRRYPACRGTSGTPTPPRQRACRARRRSCGAVPPVRPAVALAMPSRSHCCRPRRARRPRSAAAERIERASASSAVNWSLMRPAVAASRASKTKLRSPRRSDPAKTSSRTRPSPGAGTAHPWARTCGRPRLPSTYRRSAARTPDGTNGARPRASSRAPLRRRGRSQLCRAGSPRVRRY